jgi:hypothetical protein
VTLYTFDNGTIVNLEHTVLIDPGRLFLDGGQVIEITSDDLESITEFFVLTREKLRMLRDQHVQNNGRIAVPKPMLVPKR